MPTTLDRTDARLDYEAVSAAEPPRAVLEAETDLALRPEAGCLQRWLDLSA